MAKRRINRSKDEVERDRDLVSRVLAGWPLEQQIYNILRERGRETLSDLVEATGNGRGTVERAAEKLVGVGLILGNDEVAYRNKRGLKGYEFYPTKFPELEYLKPTK